MVRPGLAHLVGGKQPLFHWAVGEVEIDSEYHAGDALGEGVVVSAFGVGVGGQCLWSDVVGKFCQLGQSALSRCPSLQQSNKGLKISSTSHFM